MFREGTGGRLEKKIAGAMQVVYQDEKNRYNRIFLFEPKVQRLRVEFVQPFQLLQSFQSSSSETA
jgi:hypothetical protein